MIKRLFLIAFALLGITLLLIYIYRYQIIRYSAESLVRSALPYYVKIDNLDFDFKNMAVTFDGFRVSNPEDFSYGYLLEVPEITCKYRLKGKNLTEGFEILQPSFKRPVLNIERLGDGRVNLNEMNEVLPAQNARPRHIALKTDKESKVAKIGHAKILGGKTLPDIIKLPETFMVKDGKMIFIDRLIPGKPHIITLENIDSSLTLKLEESYSKIISLACVGIGHFNGQTSEVVKWNVVLNPTTTKLTMSNRFEVSNVNFVPLEPYYDKYSPFVFKKGRLSGTLIFDFDNGNIGSTNEVHLSDVLFYIKRGSENAHFWETTVQDLAKYFTTIAGDIIFDFKIKGEMSNPKFYLGPISKRALASMVFEKVSSAIETISKPEEGGIASKSDIEKAKEYIDFFKGLIKK